MRFRIFAFLVFIALASTGWAPESFAASSETYRQLNLFGDVFERVRSDYVEEVGDAEAVEAAINGMLSSLDPHSSYMNPDIYREMQVQTRGEFGGLGLEVTMEGGLVKVVSPIDDTPAARAGVQSGDLITHLDNEPIMGLTLSEAVERMRGPVNSSIEITIAREGEQKPIELVLTRALIKIKSVRHETEGGVGYIRITTFNEQTDSGVKAAMKDIKSKLGNKLNGIVLDLRNNPGGLLDQAVSVSDAFLDHGEIVSTRGRRAGDIQRYNARSGDLASGKPLVVLINSGSASASEIVAGALQDHRRAVILGTRSFGKGSVQTIIPLGSEGAIRLTTARYYTPSGNSIQATGIEPDLEVEQVRIQRPEDGRRVRSESSLRGHLQNENGEEQPADGAQPDTPRPDAAVTPDEVRGRNRADDYQLSYAIDLLEGMALLNQRLIN